VSTLLFHGPQAREAAVAKAKEVGRLLAPPFGEEGLKVAVAREIEEMLSVAPLGDAVGTIVIGPFDKTASVEASDALLKTLEDFDSRYTLPILWAHDAGSVSRTIRSRCLEVWCPAPEGFAPETPYMGEARSLCKAALQRRQAAVIECLAENKGDEVMLLRASCAVLVVEEKWPLDVRLRLWDSIREVLRESRGNPSPLGTLSAYLV